MLHFENIQILWFLLAIPVLTGFFILIRLNMKKRMARYTNSRLVGLLMPDYSRRRPYLKFGIVMLALACLIVAWANPQVGVKMVKGERKGADIAICIDVSNSMMAEDIQPNRLERSKKAISNLMKTMAGDRVSLVVFAGSSFIQMPLTNDYGAANMFLDQIDCSMIETQGTAIGGAIEKAMTSLGYGDEEREWSKKSSRAIIVISDGENHEDDAVEAAKDAAKEGVMVCTIGMGMPDGAPIPEYRNGKNVGYRKDKDGQTITTQLNEAMLEEIAHAGKGSYVRAGDINAGLDNIVRQLEELDKQSFGESMFSEYESRYQYPLALGILLLVVELLILERRNKRFNLQRIITRK